MNIVVDAMGGDFGIEANLSGALAAVRKTDIDVTLVGRQEELQAALAQRQHPAGRITIEPASQVIDMDEVPVLALRQKRDSSIAVGLRLVRDGRADAFVSAGNTGAIMAAGKTILKQVPGTSRPAIAALLPVLQGGVSLLLDAGANVDCKPKHLLQFALMGSLYMEHVLKIPRPRVGLLSIGHEREKGNELTRTTLDLLEKTPLNFIGNIEGGDIMNGRVDVIVCDGFVGNVALKFGESIAIGLLSFLKGNIERNFKTKMGGFLLRNVFRGLLKRVDYTEYGGAPLLGIKGCCIVCHGKSKGKSIQSAIRIASQFAAQNVNNLIQAKLPELNNSNGVEMVAAR